MNKISFFALFVLGLAFTVLTLGGCAQTTTPPGSQTPSGTHESPIYGSWKWQGTVQATNLSFTDTTYEETTSGTANGYPYKYNQYKGTYVIDTVNHTITLTRTHDGKNSAYSWTEIAPQTLSPYTYTLTDTTLEFRNSTYTKM